MVFTLQPAVGAGFVGRAELVGEIVSALRSRKVRIGFALYGPRRIGKTSVLLEVERRLKKDGFAVPAYFSLWDVADSRVESFSKLFAATVLEAYSERLSLSFKAKELLSASLSSLKTIFANAKLGVKLRDDVELLLSYKPSGEQTDLNELIGRTFSLPEKLAEQTGTRCVLLLDEFPDIMQLRNGSALGEGVVRKIRTIYETRQKTVLCICGSTRSTMNAVAFSPAAAFYRQLSAKELQPLEEKQVLELLEKNGGKTSRDAAGKIAELSGGIPFYVQWLGAALETSASKQSPQAIETAYGKLLADQGDLLFKNWLDSLSPKERSTIIAMAVHDTVSPTETANSINDNAFTAANNLSSLEEKGFLKKEGRGKYAFQDRVFKDWLKKKFS